jgi:hypothetical protein
MLTLVILITNMVASLTRTILNKTNPIRSIYDVLVFQITFPNIINTLDGLY